MQRWQRNRLARALIALAASGLLTALAGSLGPFVALVLLVLALTAIAFALLTIAPDAIALRRGHRWRWWWRASPDEGPFWPGTRIPRHPKRPR